jgi:hypothetical protein
MGGDCGKGTADSTQESCATAGELGLGRSGKSLEGSIQTMANRMGTETPKEVRPDVEVWRVNVNRFHFIPCNSAAQDWFEDELGLKGEGFVPKEIVVSSWSRLLELASQMAKDGLVVEPKFTQLTMSMLKRDIEANKKQGDMLKEWLANAQKGH